MQPTILIVEDHATVRASLADWLQVNFPECRILDVASAEEALSVAEAEVLTVVIMDIRLPQMDGLLATWQIKARQPRSRIVILSLYDEPAQRVRASAMGASAFVSKQRMHVELFPVMEANLPRRTNHASSSGAKEAAGV
jgi:two-component system, NarL family, response regulator